MVCLFWDLCFLISHGTYYYGMRETTVKPESSKEILMLQDLSPPTTVIKTCHYCWKQGWTPVLFFVAVELKKPLRTHFDVSTPCYVQDGQYCPLCASLCAEFFLCVISSRVYRPVPSTESASLISLASFFASLALMLLANKWLQSRLHSPPQTYWRHATSWCRHWRTSASLRSTVCSVPSCSHSQLSVAFPVQSAARVNPQYLLSSTSNPGYRQCLAYSWSP